MELLDLQVAANISASYMLMYLPFQDALLSVKDKRATDVIAQHVKTEPWTPKVAVNIGDAHKLLYNNYGNDIELTDLMETMHLRKPTTSKPNGYYRLSSVAIHLIMWKAAHPATHAEDEEGEALVGCTLNAISDMGLSWGRMRWRWSG